MPGLCLLLGIFLFAVTSPPAAAAGPSLSILTPANDQVVGNGTPVIVSFAVANFVLVQPGRVGQVGTPTEGHVDLYVDGVPGFSHESSPSRSRSSQGHTRFGCSSSRTTGRPSIPTSPHP